MGSRFIDVDGEVVGLIRSGKVYAAHNNPLGRAQSITDPAKTVVWRATLYSHQRKVSLDDTGGYALGFPGQYVDGESGLNYNWHRFYDPTTGRYVQADPVGLAGGINTYAYVGGNPISRIDPYGLWQIDFEAGGHIWFPMSAGAAGPNFSSSWNPQSGSLGYNGINSEYVIGAAADAGVSVGLHGLSSCPDGEETSLNVSLPFTGKYGGVELNFKGGSFDGVSLGIGVGLNLPITYTMPLESFLSSYGP